MYGQEGYGIGWLGATALPIGLSIDSGTQIVGKQPTYRIVNATPGAQVLWSSKKNGTATGEVRASYGDTIQGNGSLEIAGGNWRDDDIGTWIKEIEIQNPDGTIQQAYVMFQVVAPASVNQAPVLNTNSGFFSQPLTYIGDFAITPTTALLAIGAIWGAKQLRLIK